MSARSSMTSSWFEPCFEAQEDCGIKEMTGASQPERSTAEDYDWLLKFAPTTPAELFLPKQKLEQLTTWLHAKQQQIQLGGLLILSGPSGCGKTIALRVLSAAQDFDLIEWSTPQTFETIQGQYSSQIKTFKDFLYQATRYSSLIGEVQTKKKLLVVRDIPNTFIINPTNLHEILRVYIVTGKVPIVFVLTDNSITSNIFPRHVILEFGIQEISINSASRMTLLKILNRICSKIETSRVPSSEVLENIMNNSHGDIRNAVLQLHYKICSFPLKLQTVPGNIPTAEHKDDPVSSSSSSEKGANRKKGVRSGCGRGRKRYVRKHECPDGSDSSDTVAVQKIPKTKNRGLATRNPSDVNNSGRDSQMSIFQRVGRLLYPKKTADNSSDLLHNPEEIVAHSTSQPVTFMQMAHENYLKVYDDISATRRAIGYVSDTDIMMADIRGQDTMLPIALSTMSRGFMTTSGPTKRKWTPLTNQQSAATMSKSKAMRSFMSKDNPYHILNPVQAFLDLLPVTSPKFTMGSESQIHQTELLNSTSEEDVPVDTENQGQHYGSSSSMVLSLRSAPLNIIPCLEDEINPEHIVAYEIEEDSSNEAQDMSFYKSS